MNGGNILKRAHGDREHVSLSPSSTGSLSAASPSSQHFLPSTSISNFPARSELSSCDGDKRLDRQWNVLLGNQERLGFQIAII